MHDEICYTVQRLRRSDSEEYIYIVTGATVYRMYSILRSIGGLEIAICLSWSALSVKPEGVYTRIAI
jgi:hypothetical protein